MGGLLTATTGGAGARAARRTSQCPLRLLRSIPARHHRRLRRREQHHHTESRSARGRRHAVRKRAFDDTGVHALPRDDHDRPLPNPHRHHVELPRSEHVTNQHRRRFLRGRLPHRVHGQVAPSRGRLQESMGRHRTRLVGARASLHGRKSRLRLRPARSGPFGLRRLGGVQLPRRISRRTLLSQRADEAHHGRLRIRCPHRHGDRVHGASPR